MQYRMSFRQEYCTFLLSDSLEVMSQGYKYHGVGVSDPIQQTLLTRSYNFAKRYWYTQEKNSSSIFQSRLTRVQEVLIHVSHQTPSPIQSRAFVIRYRFREQDSGTILTSHSLSRLQARRPSPTRRTVPQMRAYALISLSNPKCAVHSVHTMSAP